MTSWTPLAWGGVTALVMSLTILATIRPLLRRWAVIDFPNARSSHDQPVLRGGGVGPAVAAVVALAVVAVQTSDRTGAVVSSICAVAVGGAALLGWTEDVRGVPTVFRALLLTVLGAGACAALAAVLEPPVWLVVLAAVGFVSFVNATNFMDGINGMSGLFGLVAGGAYTLLGYAFGIPFTAWAGVVVAAAFTAFLPWNARRARMFLGDVGSYGLGAAVALLAVTGCFAGMPLIAALGPVWIYLADTGWTLQRRVRAGEPWYEAHRSHVYQQLVDRGFSHLAVAGVVAGASGVCAALGWAASSGHPGVAGSALGGLLVVTVCYLRAPLLGRSLVVGGGAAVRTHTSAA